MMLFSLLKSFENFCCIKESREELSFPEPLRVKINENETGEDESRTSN